MILIAEIGDVANLEGDVKSELTLESRSNCSFAFSNSKIGLKMVGNMDEALPELVVAGLSRFLFGKFLVG